MLIVIMAVCLFCAWQAYLRRMAAYHRVKAVEADAAHKQLIRDYPGLVGEHPGIVLAVFLDNPGQHHSDRARDFDHAMLRPWLAFVHCKSGSVLGVPIQQNPPAPTKPLAPIVKRLAPRDDGSQQGDY